MYNKFKRKNKILETDIEIDVLVIKYTSVAVSLQRPATNNQGFLEADQLVSPFCINKHVKQVQISIPLKVQFPPKIAAKVTLKKEVHEILHSAFGIENTFIRLNNKILSCKQLPSIQSVL